MQEEYKSCDQSHVISTAYIILQSSPMLSLLRSELHLLDYSTQDIKMRTLLAFSVFVSVIVGSFCGNLPGPTTEAPAHFAKSLPHGHTQEDINAKCVQNCEYRDCYLPSTKDCRYFIQCRYSSGNYVGSLMLCAHTTYWDVNTITCVSYKEAKCINSFCSGNQGTNINHEDGNCKTYWECDAQGKETPKCCKDGYSFDESAGECRANTDLNLSNCDRQKCPLSEKGMCADESIETAPANENNCRVYWDCALERDNPSCCPKGYSYNDGSKSCEIDSTCNEDCPVGYPINECALGMESTYGVADGYCATYLKCNGTRPDEKRCCIGADEFDSVTHKCKPKSDTSCLPGCPEGYIYDCPWKEGLNASTYYQGGELMPCAEGTLFDLNMCGCGNTLQNAKDNACSMELDLKLTDNEIINTGSENTVYFTETGQKQIGERFEGEASIEFGNYSISFSFFQSQFANVYLSVVFSVEKTGSDYDNRLIILSNCEWDSKHKQEPTLEVYIVGDQIHLSIMTVNAENGTYSKLDLAVAYGKGWNEFVAYYDGNKVYVSNTAGGANPDTLESELSGEVAVASGGLNIGACRNSGDPLSLRNTFMGNIAKVQFSKCVKESWMKPKMSVP